MPKKTQIDAKQIAYLREIDFDKTLLSPKELAAAMNVHVNYVYCACGYRPFPFVMTAGVTTVNEFRSWLRQNPMYRKADAFMSVAQVVEKRGPIQKELFKA